MNVPLFLCLHLDLLLARVVFTLKIQVIGFSSEAAFPELVKAVPLQVRTSP